MDRFQRPYCKGEVDLRPARIVVDVFIEGIAVRKLDDRRTKCRARTKQSERKAAKFKYEFSTIAQGKRGKQMLSTDWKTSVYVPLHHSDTTRNKDLREHCRYSGISQRI